MSEDEFLTVDITGVEVNNRSAALAEPLGNSRAGIAPMFDDRVIADTVKMPRIDCGRLIGLKNLPTREFDCDETVFGQYGRGRLGETFNPTLIGCTALRDVRVERCCAKRKTRSSSETKQAGAT